MGSSDEPLTGFSWKYGSKSDTQGVIFWNDVFLHENLDEKIAIFIMDTQGLFEPKKTLKENTRIFGLSTLISSVQIYNMEKTISEMEIEYLEMTTTFTNILTNQGTNAVKTNFKPFQSLIFLIRDFNDEDYPFGYQGGNTKLNEVLLVEKDDHDSTATTVRKNIYKTFDNISCFLMPNPGSRFIKKGANGSNGLMDIQFKTYLEVFIKSLFEPNSLKKKKIFGNEVTGSSLITYLLAFFEIYESDKSPEIQSIFELTAEKQMEAIMKQILNQYSELMKKRVDYDKTDFEQSILYNHVILKAQAIENYTEVEKIGGEVMNKKFKNILKERIDNEFNEWKDQVLAIYIERTKAKKVEEERLMMMVSCNMID